MKPKGISRLMLFAAFLFLVNLACSAVTQNTPPTTIPPVEQPTQASLPNPTEPPTLPPTEAPSSGGLVTFTDQNELYQIQVPGDWTHTQSSGEFYYIDTFTSPDEKAMVENIVYDDGTTFNGGQKGRFALKLIYKFYSKTGTSSDIKITSDQIMNDGSERLEWQSRGGGYSGASYFETRTGRTTFLMFTIEWMDDAEGLYLDTLNEIVASYAIP